MSKRVKEWVPRLGRALSIAGLAALWLPAAASRAGAGLVALDEPFVVNEVTAGEQGVPKAAAATSGQAMFVWDSAADGDDLGVVGRVYDTTGEAVGGDFLVNSYTAGSQFGPVIDALSGGGFVVVWQSYDFAGGDDALFGRRFAADGAALGTEFRVDISISEFHAQPDVAARADGGFVVVWDDYVDVFALRLDSGGAPIGSEFRVNESDGSMTTAQVGAAADGSFVVTWTDDSEIDGDGMSVLARRFASSGAPFGGELQVNTTTTGDQYGSAMAVAPAGEFMVVWETYGQTAEGDGLFGQRFAAAGTKLGTQFRVDSGSSVYAGAAAVAAGADGEFVVVWDEPRDGNGYVYSVMARRFADATASEPFAVAADSTADQSQADVAPGADDDFLVVWREEIDEGDIFAQHIAAPRTPGPSCDGDCNGNGRVSIAELIVAVNVSLGTAPTSRCTAADANGNGAVAINELILAVNSSLFGC